MGYCGSCIIVRSLVFVSLCFQRWKFVRFLMAFLGVYTNGEDECEDDYESGDEDKPTSPLQPPPLSTHTYLPNSHHDE